MPSSFFFISFLRVIGLHREWGYSTRRQCWATSAQRRYKRRCTYRPSVIYLIVNKLGARARSLSLSLTHLSPLPAATKMAQ